MRLAAQVGLAAKGQEKRDMIDKRDNDLLERNDKRKAKAGEAAQETGATCKRDRD
jgi:hypothetical protein